MNALAPQPRMLDYALSYAERGWHVFPLAPGTKIPLIPKRKGGNGHKDATTDPDQIRRWWTANPYANIGLNCAASGLVTVDPDTYRPECEWASFIRGRDLPNTLVQSTPRGGTHYIFQAPPGKHFDGELCKCVDVKHDGYIVLEPSVFEGGRYQFETDDDPAPAPDWIPRKDAPREQNVVRLDVGGAFKGIDDYRRLIIGARTDGQKHAATRDLAASLAAQGVNEKFTTALIQAICPVWDANLQNSITSAYEKYRGNSFRHNGLDLIRDDKDRPIWNAANAEKLLTEHEDWQGVFSFNVFSGHRMRGEHALDDDDYQDVTAWFNANGFPKASQQVVVPAVRKVCRKHSFDPLHDYLESLRWDKTPRLASWLTTYCGAEASPYVSEVGMRWCVSAVARGFKPGCKADHMLVLEGAQGRRKSSALAALAGEDWFSDALPQMGTKDASSYLRGKWIVEVAELEAMRREVDAIKAFISRQVENYRPAYGREEVSEPRRCVFAGTTNKDDWHRDETGGRRFWPVKVGEIDVPGIERDRDHLWAEAVALYRSGERWWLEGDVVEQAQAEVAERAADDPWRDDIERALRGRDETTTKEVLAVMGVEIKDMTPALSKRVAKELVLLGWERAGRVTGGAYRYVPGVKESEGRVKESEASEGKVKE